MFLNSSDSYSFCSGEDKDKDDSTPLIRKKGNTFPLNEKNIKLIQDAQNGDQISMTNIIEHNMGLVGDMINKMCHGYIAGKKAEVEDLENSGRIGLMLAVQSFDFSKKCAFSTHAHYKILKEIEKCLIESSGMKRSVFRRISRINTLSLNDKKKNIESLAKKLGATTKQIENTINFNHSHGFPLYTSTPLLEDGEKNIGDIISDPRKPENFAGENIDINIIKENVKNSLKKLSTRNKDIVEMYFLSDKDYTYKNIGEQMGIKTGTVRQISVISLKTLSKISKLRKINKELG